MKDKNIRSKADSLKRSMIYFGTHFAPKSNTDTKRSDIFQIKNPYYWQIKLFNSIKKGKGERKNKIHLSEKSVILYDKNINTLTLFDTNTF